jgi:hypothetical protein
MAQAAAAQQADPNQEFYDKAKRALEDLFEKAKAKNELHFAMALMPEFRGQQDGGWNTAEEALLAFDQYTEHIKSLDKDSIIRIRIILAFYLMLSECSGFYEIPKKLMLTIEGKGNNVWPFQSLVRRHEKTGRAIDPNANKIMKNMMGHAYDIGLHELSDIFRDAFDPDLRNAIAHADYILAADGVRIRKRNGGQPRVVSWADFDALFCKGANLFDYIRQFAAHYAKTYDPPKKVKGKLSYNEPEMEWMIYYLPKSGAFGLTTGEAPKDA